MVYKHTRDTIYTHFQGITDNIYGFGRLFCSLIVYPFSHISTYPQQILPIQMHKAMVMWCCKWHHIVYNITFYFAESCDSSDVATCCVVSGSCGVTWYVMWCCRLHVGVRGGEGPDGEHAGSGPPQEQEQQEQGGHTEPTRGLEAEVHEQPQEDRPRYGGGEGLTGRQGSHRVQRGFT